MRTSSKHPRFQPGAPIVIPSAKGDIAINKKFLWITAALLGLILGGEMLLPLIEEIGMLAFEWAHKTLDLLFTDVFGLEDEASQRASAWTGLFLLLGLLGWGSHTLRRKYLQAKATAPHWWAEQKAWWADLPWLFKLIHIAIGFGLLGILALFI